MKKIDIGTDVMTRLGLGTIVAIDSTTYSIDIYKIELDDDMFIAIPRAAFTLPPKHLPTVNRQARSIYA